jgi:mono/diheme cytochrome c family protein
MKTRLVCLSVALMFSGAAFAQDGAAIYKAKCAICHGADGAGKPKLGSKLIGTPKSEDAIVALLTKSGAEKGKHVKPIDGLTADQAKAAAGVVKSFK